jgi:hypothetical protein
MNMCVKGLLQSLCGWCVFFVPPPPFFFALLCFLLYQEDERPRGGGTLERTNKISKRQQNARLRKCTLQTALALEQLCLVEVLAFLGVANELTVHEEQGVHTLLATLIPNLVSTKQTIHTHANTICKGREREKEKNDCKRTR